MTQEELQKALEALGKGGITVNGDLVLSKHVEHEVGNVEAGGIGIQNVFHNNADKPAAAKKSAPKKKSEKKVGDKPHTLKYYTHGNNGVLRRQQERVDIVFRKFIDWGWIDDKTVPDDFDNFFEGEKRFCNITWTSNSTILTFLLQGLLQQPYIERQTNCSASSLVDKQFGKTANFDRSRLDQDAESKINLIILILDIKNPLPERHNGEPDGDYDTSDAALMEIYSGNLRSTKGI